MDEDAGPPEIHHLPDPRPLLLVLNRHAHESVRGGADSIRTDDHATWINAHDDGVRLSGDVDLHGRGAVWILQEAVTACPVDIGPNELSERIDVPDRGQFD